MAFIPEDKIADIRNAVNIVDLVSESVLLKKSGKDYKGLCPFHSEKTPSFTVSPEKQIFYCFGCHTGGDVFSFLMKQEGLSFPEAVKRLADQHGFDIRTRPMSLEQERQMREREAMFSVNKQAADYFHDILLHHNAGKKAMAYLKTRGLSRDTIEAFCIGYDPGGDSFVRYCSQKGISLKLAERAGLIGAKNGRFYDRFWNRVIFPIFDAGGTRTVGFGGRLTDDANPRRPKYYNSPETRVYNKSQSLYGLNRARQTCRRTDTVFIVEGYVDVLSLHQHGIRNVVAGLGTSLTSAHARQIKGYARKAILVYDSDDAGIRAANRVKDILNEDLEVRILVLPSGYDPDSFLFKFGSEAFVSAADNALSVMAFMMDSAIREHGLSIEGKVRIVSSMRRALASVHDGVARALYVKALSERIGVGEAEILGTVRNEILHRNNVKKRPGQNPMSRPEPRESHSPQGIYKLERQIIAMMFQFPEILSEIRDRNLVEQLENDTLRTIGQIILDRSTEGHQVSDLINLIHDKEKKKLAVSLAMRDDPLDREGCLGIIRHFQACQRRRNKHALTISRGREISAILKKIDAVEDKNDRESLLRHYSHKFS